MNAADPRFSFEFSPKILLGMALFQQGGDSLGVLNSTQFEISALGDHRTLTLVATDGRRMAIHSSEILSENLLTDIPESSAFSVDLLPIAKLPAAKVLR